MIEFPAWQPDIKAAGMKPLPFPQWNPEMGEVKLVVRKGRLCVQHGDQWMILEAKKA